MEMWLRNLRPSDSPARGLEPRAEAKQDGYDMWLLVSTLLLVGIGIVMVYSASFQFAAERWGISHRFLVRQAIYSVVGLLAMITVMRMDYHVWGRKQNVYMLVGGVAFLLVLVLVVGKEVNGASRWLHVGPFQMQPAELAKFAAVIFMGYGLLAKNRQMKSFQFGFVPLMLIPLVLAMLILKEPDFGSASLIVMFVLVMLFLGGTDLRYLLGTVGIFTTGAVFLVAMSAYKRARITAFLDPWADPLGSGYHIIHSLIAFGSGGLFGNGLGEGREKMLFLPELHTDFILANVGEEFGFVGVLFIIALFLFFLGRGFLTSMRASDLLGAYIAFGATLLLGMQAAINMGVAMQLLPITGLTLPFLSYGGSSLVVCMSLVGLILSVSAKGRQVESAKSPSILNRKAHAGLAGRSV